MAMRRLDEYYPLLKSRTTYMLVGVELGIGLISWTATYLIYSQLGIDGMFLAAIGMLVFFATQIAATPFLVEIFTEPTKLIVEAITHVSKQTSDVTPPNVNLARHEKSGLKTVVQAIYEMAVGTTHELDVASGNRDGLAGNNPFLSQLLTDVPCGVIALNKDRQVIYSNQQAPVHINPRQEQEIELNFEKDNSLTTWLIDCESSKVRDTKVWTRVSNKLPDEDGVRYFDVIAYYQKESTSADTILVTIDRSAEYAPMQESMDFIALAAHELRGPITVIRGYLDVLAYEMRDKMLPDEKQLFERLSVSANRLNTYVNNILNVSSFDRQHLQLHLHEISIANLFESIVDDISIRARTQNRILSINIPPDIPSIAADRNSLAEVVVNLIDNAIKYSNEGGQVIVNAELKGEFVEITVQDFGVGIPSSVMGKLFSKFYRSHRSRTAIAGTGLGLYISKAIIESHGGQIWARSTEGQGSMFGFSVPVYASVADKLIAGNNSNEDIIESSSGWIKNHAMTRR